jgi:hypothetical protein
VCALPLSLHTRPWGASGARHSLRPRYREGGKLMANLGRMARRDREGVFDRRVGKAKRAHHLTQERWARRKRAFAHPTIRHHPRKRMIQYSRDASDRSEKPRRTGSPACAGDDGILRRAAPSHSSQECLTPPCASAPPSDAPSWRDGVSPAAPESAASPTRGLSGSVSAHPSG